MSHNHLIVIVVADGTEQKFWNLQRSKFSYLKKNKKLKA